MSQNYGHGMVLVGVGAFHDVEVPFCDFCYIFFVTFYLFTLKENTELKIVFAGFSTLIGAVRMTSIGVCSDTSDAVELLEAQGLCVKPVAKLNISVQLPQLKAPGASISNWEVMEKLKKMIKPDSFLVLKVVLIV